MELAQFIDKYWQKTDSRILFANYANQRKLGLIPDAIDAAFKAHLGYCTISEPTAQETLSDKSTSGSTFDRSGNGSRSIIIALQRLIHKVKQPRDLEN